jgi:hypothetical protein
MKGQRTKLTLLNIFGEPYELEGTIVGEKTHGFNTPEGGWSLYGHTERGDTPAEFILFVPKGKRKARAINRASITDRSILHGN